MAVTYGVLKEEISLMGTFPKLRFLLLRHDQLKAEMVSLKITIR